MISKLDGSVSSISSIFNVRMMMLMWLLLIRLLKVVADPSPSSESDDKMMGVDAEKKTERIVSLSTEDAALVNGASVRIFFNCCGCCWEVEQLCSCATPAMG